MTAPNVYGWCPGALRPMMSGDGLVVRVRPRLGRLSAGQVKGVADLSRRFGNGLLDVSARANLQMRGVTEQGHPELLNGLRELGLLDSRVEVETRRNVMVQPFWTEGDDTHRVALALTEALEADDAPVLPGKFGFAVDCGDVPLLSGVSADIRVERGDRGLILRPDGSATGAPVTVETVAQNAIALARWFLETGGVKDGRGRMRAHVMRGTPVPEGFSEAPNPGDQPPGPGGCLVGLEFGQIAAEDFGELGALRLTPWRMLLLENEVPDIPGLILAPNDPRLRVTACTGAPGCLQGLSQTRQLARDLAEFVPSGQTLHVSGCAKGCANPGPAPAVLTATGPDRFDLIRNGTADAKPTRTDIDATALRSAPDLIWKET